MDVEKQLLYQDFSEIKIDKVTIVEQFRGNINGFKAIRIRSSRLAETRC